MRYNAVTIELAGDIVDDERYSELDGMRSIPLLATTGVVGTYLDNDANEDEAFILALTADAAIPDLHAPKPVARSSHSTPSRGQQRPVGVIGMDQVRLLAADNDKLLVLRLPEANADGQVQVHGPVFDRARPGAIQGVDGEDHEAEDVNDQDREEHQSDLSHLDHRMVALIPEVDACRVQAD